MKNKYKEEISRYNISYKTKEKLLSKIESHKVKNYQPVYICLIILLAGIISVGMVYAKDIKELIESWGKTKVTFYEESEINEKIELDTLKIIKTNLDDYKLDNDVYSKLEILSNDYPIPTEGITYFKDKMLVDIEKEIGVDFLGFEDLKYEYQYNEITDERKIGSISIKSEEYVVKCGTRGNKESCLPIAKNYKGLSIRAEIKTKNTNYEGNTEWEYDFSHEDIDPKIIKFEKIGDLNINGFSHIIPIKDNDGTIDEFVTDMYFNYKNIKYTINAINLTNDEIINILKDKLR